MKFSIPAAALILVGGACLLPLAVHAEDAPPPSASASTPALATTPVADPDRDQSSRISASVSLSGGGGGGGGDNSVVAIAPRTDNTAIRGSTDGDVTK